MNKDSHTNNAPVPFSLTDKTGEDWNFKMYALSDRDISELDEWLRNKYVQGVRRSLKDEENDKIYDREMSAAHRFAASLTWLSGDGAKQMATVDGMAQLTLQGIHGVRTLTREQKARDVSPEITFEELRELMFLARNVDESNKIFTKVNNVDPDTGKAKAAALPPRVTKANRKKAAKKKAKKKATRKAKKNS